MWLDTITHVTEKGTSEFGLTNTNKLVRSYEGCVGLKTGSTSVAKYCVSAVAKRNGITLISVVMTAPDYKVRFKDAAAMQMCIRDRDLECMRRKQEMQERQRRRYGKNQKISSSGEISEKKSFR